jgi:hypothetical protein
VSSPARHLVGADAHGIAHAAKPAERPDLPTVRQFEAVVAKRGFERDKDGVACKKSGSKLGGSRRSEPT